MSSSNVKIIQKFHKHETLFRNFSSFCRCFVSCVPEGLLSAVRSMLCVAEETAVEWDVRSALFMIYYGGNLQNLPTPDMNPTAESAVGRCHDR